MNARRGRLRWAPVRSLLWTGSLVAVLVAGPTTASLPAFGCFAVLSGLSLCAGHSVGLHRGLIHRSFLASRWLMRLLVWLGTLVGLGGPLSLIRMHELRDWAQHQRRCHWFFAHARPLWIDLPLQIHAELELEDAPTVVIDPDVADDPFYRFLERTWAWQQLPAALVLFWLGGWPFVVWGGCARIVVGVAGHSFVGHFAHRRGRQHAHSLDAAVQGYNLPWLGALSFGEGHHNNHHTTPWSARMGLHRGELDLGWLLLRALAALGLVEDLQTPDTQRARPPRPRTGLLADGFPGAHP